MKTFVALQSQENMIFRPRFLNAIKCTTHIFKYQKLSIERKKFSNLPCKVLWLLYVPIVLTLESMHFGYTLWLCVPQVSCC